MLAWLTLAFAAGAVSVYFRERSRPSRGFTWLLLPWAAAIGLIVLSYALGYRTLRSSVWLIPAASVGGMAGRLLANRARKRSGVRF